MTTATAETDAPTDPDAPYGRKPNGEPYKRDPGPFLHLRGKRGPERRETPREAPRKATPKKASPAGRPAGDHGERVARWIGLGAAVARGRGRHLDAAIVDETAAALVDPVNRMCAEDPRIGAVVDRLGTLFSPGGAKGEAAMVLGTGILALGFTRGVGARNPVVNMLVGGLVERSLMTAAYRLAGELAAQRGAGETGPSQDDIARALAMVQAGMRMPAAPPEPEGPPGDR